LRLTGRTENGILCAEGGGHPYIRGRIPDDHIKKGKNAGERFEAEKGGELDSYHQREKKDKGKSFRVNTPNIGKEKKKEKVNDPW